MEKKEFLTDQNGTIVYPKTIVEAIIDAAQKLVLNGGDQSGIKGMKDFADGLSINGRKVLAEGDIQPFELVASGIPGDDIFQITKSGIYYYKETTKNVPHFEPIENSTGYIWAVFQKDSNYGLLFFLGSFTYIEKWAGTWRKFFSPQPVKIWAGNAKPGDKVVLADATTNYRYLRFTVKGNNNQMPITIDADQSAFYLTIPGLTNDGKGLYIDEAHLTIAADRKTLTYADRKWGNVMTGAVANANANLIMIEGIR